MLRVSTAEYLIDPLQQLLSIKLGTSWSCRCLHWSMQAEQRINWFDLNVFCQKSTFHTEIPLISLGYCPSFHYISQFGLNQKGFTGKLPKHKLTFFIVSKKVDRCCIRIREMKKDFYDVIAFLICKGQKVSLTLILYPVRTAQLVVR